MPDQDISFAKMPFVRWVDPAILAAFCSVILLAVACVSNVVHWAFPVLASRGHHGVRVAGGATPGRVQVQHQGGTDVLYGGFQCICIEWS
jgi:hypothetical protein